MTTKTKILSIALLPIFFVSCTTGTTVTTLTTEPNIASCEESYPQEYGEYIPITNISLPYSTLFSNTTNFISPCNLVDEYPLILGESSTRTHQIILDFDAIYPVENIVIYNQEENGVNPVEKITVEYTISNERYLRTIIDYPLIQGENIIPMNQNAKSIKLILEDQNQTQGISSIHFTLGEGYIVRDEPELSNLFLRQSGWTGADGIFSFDMNHGGDQIGQNHTITSFLFSDTFIGDVNEKGIRFNYDFINNSFGYLNHETNEISFDWDQTQEKPLSVLSPNAYIGKQPRNLLDSDGLTIGYHKQALLTNMDEGIMWLTNEQKPTLVIDLHQSYTLSELVLWNYNGQTDYGVKSFKLFFSDDLVTYEYYDTFHLNQASGELLEPYTLDIILDNIQTRYIKIEVIESYHDTFTGLGKIMLFGLDHQPLYGSITASSSLDTLEENEASARLWLQDGVIIDDKVYVFPILVKDFENFFKVHNVGMIEMNITNNQFDYQNAVYYSTPLMSQTEESGLIYFGAGLLDNREIDGFIYIYGYLDLDGRNLIVARFQKDDIHNFNEWEYYGETGFMKDINQVKPLLKGVSPELSVTYMQEGYLQGKYLLVAMENSTSGKIVSSLSDTPFGPFTEFETIYSTELDESLLGAFSYNAKLHPNLSTYDKLIISYNVNTTNLFALKNVNIYYPRFISLTEITKKEE